MYNGEVLVFGDAMPTHQQLGTGFVGAIWIVQQLLQNRNNSLLIKATLAICRPSGLTRTDQNHFGVLRRVAMEE